MSLPEQGSSAPEIVVRRLERTDPRGSFRSGNIDLDRFFQRYAGQNQFRHHIGTTWVAMRKQEIVGFATVAAGHLEAGALPEGARRPGPAHPLPILRLARLAVSEDVQGEGVGRLLLRAVLAIAHRMTDEVGCVGVVVDAKPEAVGLYRTLGFLELTVTRGALGDRPEPIPMFVALSAIPRP